MPGTVLIIASESTRREQLREELKELDCRVVAASHAEEGVEQAARVAPDVVLLENGVSEHDPLEVCRRLRVELPAARLPYIMLLPPESRRIDRAAWNDLVRALVGSAQANGDDVLQCGPLRIDTQRYRATLGGDELNLTLTEFRLLTQLMLDPGVVHTRAALCEACGRDSQAIQERTVDVHIKSIRHKLGDHAYLVETVRGVGYRCRDSQPARL
ncbi:MAG: response regulator transcription factor [Pirellulaceae bacterium]|nr:response regulator transcription factor [Planctomycetales bacterium]MCA9209128.1 response regulator transcription factor [Planctomycetales bacterium]MCA9219352.1 response regulator transcription factor [Planctomycetales bacterium]